jgi:hypothetical protein
MPSASFQRTLAFSTTYLWKVSYGKSARFILKVLNNRIFHSTAQICSLPLPKKEGSRCRHTGKIGVNKEFLAFTQSKLVRILTATYFTCRLLVISGKMGRGKQFNTSSGCILIGFLIVELHWMQEG